MELIAVIAAAILALAATPHATVCAAGLRDFGSFDIADDTFRGDAVLADAKIDGVPGGDLLAGLLDETAAPAAVTNDGAAATDAPVAVTGLLPGRDGLDADVGEFVSAEDGLEGEEGIPEGCHSEKNGFKYFTSDSCRKGVIVGSDVEERTGTLTGLNYGLVPQESYWAYYERSTDTMGSERVPQENYWDEVDPIMWKEESTDKTFHDRVTYFRQRDWSVDSINWQCCDDYERDTSRYQGIEEDKGTNCRHEKTRIPDEFRPTRIAVDYLDSGRICWYWKDCFPGGYLCDDVFYPSSTLVTYQDVGSCGPRGDDAQADLSQCAHGYHIVKDVPLNGWKIVAYDNYLCGYFAYTIYKCNVGKLNQIAIEE